MTINDKLELINHLKACIGIAENEGYLSANLFDNLNQFLEELETEVKP